MKIFPPQACFDIREASVVWTLMQVKDTVDGTSIPEFMSTHPSNETRVELIDFLIPKVCRNNQNTQNKEMNHVSKISLYKYFECR